MTRKTFEKAKGIIDDIKSLKNIKSEYKDNHWISFYGAEVKEQPITNGILRNDLEKFIDDEIVKLEKELEKL
ncbi:MAG: hypothetical protein J6F30_04675 [Cellulosilyticum sp.]|nr:hypothetical protein [Cellulosilyticum sp.]